jgi:hypothetical protein
MSGRLVTLIRERGEREQCSEGLKIKMDGSKENELSGGMEVEIR